MKMHYPYLSMILSRASNWFSHARSRGKCPCCGGDNVKMNAVDEWHRCLDASVCPLANVGGYFTESQVSIQEKTYDLDLDVEELKDWAVEYAQEDMTQGITSDPKVGETYTLINSKHSWNNGKRIVITGVDKPGIFSARSEHPDKDGMVFVTKSDIGNVAGDPRDLVGEVVKLIREPKQHSSNVSGLKFIGEEVQLGDWIESMNWWVVRIPDAGYSLYSVGKDNLAKVQ